MRLQLTFAAGTYDFVRPLADGTVKPDGIDLIVLSGMGSGERHHRMGRGQEFDLCEFNAAAYLAARDQDVPWLALPVFLHRRFRHGFVFVNPAKGIATPPDLRGKRVGGPTFLAAGNVWMRGILEEHHGAPHREVTWFVEREDAVDYTPPAGLRYERVPDGVRAEKMMLDGDLDAHPLAGPAARLPERRQAHRAAVRRQQGGGSRLLSRRPEFSRSCTSR